MKSRDLLVFVAAGVIAGGAIAWTAARNAPKPPAPNEPAATTTAHPSVAPSLESVPRIPMPAFRQRLERGEIVVIDVRDVEDYTAAHIPGAIHIPLSYMQGELPYLPRGKPIVTYCT
jgi:3-mercaptopyruvate sulfurtransferase SseA